MKRSQIAFDIPQDLKHEIKLAAVTRNIGIGQWLIRCIRKELRATMGNPIKQCECFQEK